MNPLLLPELRELVAEKKTGELASFLEKLLPSQAAELIEGLSLGEISTALAALQSVKAALIFEYLAEEKQLALAAGVGRGDLARLLDAMSPDDRAVFVRRLPEVTVGEILPLMAQAERNDVKRLLSFSEGTAGFRMTTEYASISPGLNCGDALAKVRQEAPDKETIYNIFVLDADRHLEGVVGLKDLLLSRPETPVVAVMHKEAVTIRSDESAAEAASRIQKYDLIVMPVVDDAGRMLGILTVDDLIDVLEKEATQDILSLGAVEPGALNRPYFENAITHVVRTRLGWLLLLFVAEMFTGTVLRHFDEAIARVVALSFFIPLLIGTGGNCGSQTVSTIIRSLALGEIKTSDWLRVLAREAWAGLLLGILLGCVGAIRSLMWDPHDYQLAMTVGFTLVAICAWSNAVAALIPIFAQRAGLDPTVLSAPLITTLVDATGLIIYFTIAMNLITKLGEPMQSVPAELSQRILDVAKDAPQQVADQLRAIALPANLETHSHEWFFPAIACAVLVVVMFSMTRKPGQKTS